MCLHFDRVMSGLSKNSGRGFNVAVVDPKEKKVVSTAQFDTYEKGTES